MSKTNAVRKCNSSMQLTRAADYGVRVMVELASLPPDVRVLLPALAESTAAPESFLSKVLQALARAGLIASRRGKTGGFVLLPRGRAASVRDVVEAIDGPICLNVCLAEGTGCDRAKECPAHPVWFRAQRAMVEVLQRASIKEMATCVPTAPEASAGNPLAVVSVTT
ncbi:MAG TPA: Rrf2 family transcriptional regulator [Terracidiphilus sp.]|nr:Rrf2 family transcriptional regulator [Terracidiphilus sp.]